MAGASIAFLLLATGAGASGPAFRDQWVRQWEFTRKEILRIDKVPLPRMIFYDSKYVYDDGRKFEHGGTLSFPDGKTVPVALMSFASSHEKKVFFVMAAPEFWKAAGVDSKEVGRERMLSAVFLHEFAHTRQIPGLGTVIGPIDDSWSFPQELDDDVVQKRFGSDPEYKAAYEAEDDLLYRAANAATDDEARQLGRQALEMIRARRAKWFTGENAIFATLDDVFLAFEGAGQWTAYAWLKHPQGGKVPPDVAMASMRRSKKWWTQEEGLGLFLLIDRLLPGWQKLAFGAKPIGAEELLTRALNEPGRLESR